MMAKSGADFETLVAQVIGHLSIFRGGHVRVFRNKRYAGSKDPIGYEIDISMEMTLSPGLRLLFIVECKAHSRPVERSVVQQFIQVRDDISAPAFAVSYPVKKDFTSAFSLLIWRTIARCSRSGGPKPPERLTRHPELEARDHLTYNALSFELTGSIGFERFTIKSQG